MEPKDPLEQIRKDITATLDNLHSFIPVDWTKEQIATVFNLFLQFFR